MTIGWCISIILILNYQKHLKKISSPTPVKKPELVILNEELAKNLNLNFSGIDKKKLAEIFSGKQFT